MTTMIFKNVLIIFKSAYNKHRSKWGEHMIMNLHCFKLNVITDEYSNPFCTLDIQPSMYVEIILSYDSYFTKCPFTKNSWTDKKLTL